MKPGDGKKWKLAATRFVAGGLILAALGLAYRFCTPRTYQSSARVRVENRGRRTDRRVDVSEQPLMGGELQLLSSDALLSQVVENLGLREKWRNHGDAHGPLSKNGALLLLQAKVHICPVPDTSLLEVDVTSDDRSEPSAIANEIVRLFCDYHVVQRRKTSHDDLESLKVQWEEQNQQFLAARERLAAVVREINQARSGTKVYDPESLESMRARRAALETECLRQQDQLNQLQALEPDRLRLVLPTLVTNDLLNGSLDKLATAQRELSEARTRFGTNSPEVKRAAANAQELDRFVSQATAGVLVDLAANLSAQKSLLTNLIQQLACATTNVDIIISTNNPAYVAAVRNLRELEEQRDALKSRLDAGLKQTVSPLVLSAQVVDSAMPPDRPFSPNEQLARLIILAGLTSGITGLLLLLIARKAGSLEKKT